MSIENRVVAAIALCGIDAGKVTEYDDMAVTVFEFFYSDVSVKRIAQTMDGAICYSVSVVHNSLLTPLAKVWLGANREPGIVVYDAHVPLDVRKWLLDIVDVLEVDNEQ